MDRKKGMILLDLAVYMFAGSIMLWACLNTYVIARKTYDTMIISSRERLDFLQVSERLKFDLYNRPDSIHVYNDGVRFTFKDFSPYTDGRYDNKIYYLKMAGVRLSYVVLGDKRVTMMLSELVRGIDVSVSGNVMTIGIRYDNSYYERSYRIDHIAQKSIYNSVLPSSEY